MINYKPFFMKKKLLSLFGAMLLAQISFSQVLERFNYADGANLKDQNGWSVPLGTGNSLTILNTSFVSLGGNAAKSVRLGGSSTSEQSEISTSELNGGRVFRETEGEILYVALAINVASAPTGDEYFANVSGGLNGAGTVVNARGRMYVKNIDDKLAFGVAWGANASSGQREYTEAIYDFNRTYILVLKFIGIDKNAQLFVFDGNLPSTQPSSPTLSTTSSEGFINGRGFVIRHTSTSQNILVGGIIASTSWPTGMTITKATLPIELNDFKASEENNFVRLNWSTLSEKNNNYFEILKSIDGINFVKIGTVNGSQNNNQKQDYSFVDKSAASSKVVYYKLKQVDNNGDSEEFTPISFKYSSITNSELIVFKNNNGLVQAKFNAQKGNLNAQVFTIAGIKVAEIANLIVVDGLQNLVFNKSLGSGIYIIKLKNNKKYVTSKFSL
jgi:hypothetical protein